MAKLPYPKDQSLWLRWETDASFTRGDGTVVKASGDMRNGTVMLNTAGALTKVAPASATAASDLVLLYNDIVNDADNDQLVSVIENGPCLLVGEKLDYNGATDAQKITINSALAAKNFKIV